MKNPVKFGKYYLLERISVGGMAEVFKAKSFGEAGFERLVAVKRILPSIAEDQEFIAMFVDEAKLAVQLTHPNIAQIFELGKVGEAYFIALEYVAGKDMRAIFERARKRTESIPIPMACYMVMKLCEGLDYAHNKKDAAGRSLELVHRDVSPQNILVSYDGDVKLIDFGIAKAASKSSKTQAGILKGKFGYMSPEQVRGLTVDRRSDVFAVGICLYELLTMERLFVGESDFSTLEKVRNVEIMPPSTYNKKIPEELEAIVLKALAKHPEDRYRTAMDLHDDLQSFMYTSGNFFARKDLASYQHRLFGEEISKEAARDEEYKKFDSRRASDLEVFEGAGAPQPPMAQGRQAPPGPPSGNAARPAVSAPPPPPPPPRPPSKTVMGVGAGASMPVASAAVARPASVPATPVMRTAPGVSAAPVAVATAQASAPAPQHAEMDWDEEELETQVFDKPDGAPSMAPPMPPPASPPRSTAAPRNTASIPVVPALPQIPSVPAIPGTARGPLTTSLGIAPPPPPAASLPAAPLPSSSLPAVSAPPPGTGPMLSGPAIGAPGFMPSGVAVPPPPMAPPGNVSVPAPAAQPSGATSGVADRSNPPSGRGADWPASPSSFSPPRRRDNTLVVVFAFFGVLAVACAVVLVLRLTRGEPVGSLAITTNVGGVAVLVDDQPQIGNGQAFAVNNLSSQRIHHVVVRKPGFRTFQQDVPVAEAQITPMQVVLEPEPSLAAAPQPLPSFQVPPVAQPVAQPDNPTNPVVAQPTVQQPAIAPQPAQPPQPLVAPQPTQPVIAQPAQPVAPVPHPAAVTHPATTVATAHPPAHPPLAANHPPAAHPVHANTQQAVPVIPVPPVAAPPHPTASSAGASPGGMATLRISTRPAAQCTINGETFSTPSIRHLPPGTYRIACHNDDLQARASWPVTLHDGEDVRDLNHALDN